MKKLLRQYFFGFLYLFTTVVAYIPSQMIGYAILEFYNPQHLTITRSLA